jgi:hypothetical protein
MVSKYVSFYFAPRSPMLYVINRGFVEGYDEGQGPVLHLVSTIEAVQAANLPFVFTDGHAEVDFSRYFTDLADLDQIDWDVMVSRYWNDTLEDGDRKRRRQAEFLVDNFFPFSLFHSIGVLNRTMAIQVSSLIQPLAQKPDVQIQPTWYY